MHCSFSALLISAFVTENTAIRHSFINANVTMINKI